MDNIENNVVDLFKEELKKAEKKEKKKLDKLKKKEEKKKQKEEKRLARIEDKAFALKQKKEDKLKQEKEKQLKGVKTDKTPSIGSFLYDTLFGFFLVIILLASIVYNIYGYINKTLDLANGILLLLISINFVLTLCLKQENTKKFFGILVSISMAAFVCYQIFII